jgi:hypothetical protein
MTDRILKGVEVLKSRVTDVEDAIVSLETQAAEELARFVEEYDVFDTLMRFCLYMNVNVYCRRRTSTQRRPRCLCVGGVCT